MGYLFAGRIIAFQDTSWNFFYAIDKYDYFTVYIVYCVLKVSYLREDIYSVGRKCNAQTQECNACHSAIGKALTYLKCANKDGVCLPAYLSKQYSSVWFREAE